MSTGFEAPERRLEGPLKVTGAARYAADVHREGELQVALLRSPHPHARIVSIDVSAAKALPGVRAVLTGADVRPSRVGRRHQDWPVLAWDRVRCVGDRVAAVAAETLAEAEAAVAAIEVAYEPLRAIVDPDEALAADAPILHPDAADHVFLGGTRVAVPHPNVVGHARHEHGDVDAAFAAAAHVFEHEFTVPPVYTAAIEPRAALVWLEGDTYHVVSTNKGPFSIRGQLAASLGVAPERIVVESCFIGGDFGGKGLSIDEYVLCFLARATGRPVRSVTRYADDMRASNTRHAAKIRLRTGVDAAGRFVAHEASVRFDGGAYAAGKPGIRAVPGEALSTLAGYHVPNARVEAVTVYTNNVPAGNARAPGQPQNAFAAESHVDLIARALGIDPLVLRLRNAVRPGEVDVHGEVWERGGLTPVLERLQAEVAQGAPLPPGHGRGVALGARSSPAGAREALYDLRVTHAGRVEVLTGVPDQGGGAHTMIQRVVGAALGLPADRIDVRHGSTADMPFDAGVGGSRVTPIVGGAVAEGARALRRRLAEIVPGEPLEAQLAAVARAGGLTVTGTYEHAPGYHSTCAYAVEVAVDRETGAVRIVGALLVADVGTVINPVALRGQLEGGFVFGLGQTLTEELVLADGHVANAHLGDYKIPAMPDVPPLRIVHAEGEGSGPFGAKSAGELANPAVGAAVANAVADAVGARLRSLPVTAEKVLGALREVR